MNVNLMNGNGDIAQPCRAELQGVLWSAEPARCPQNRGPAPDTSAFFRSGPVDLHNTSGETVNSEMPFFCNTLVSCQEQRAESWVVAKRCVGGMLMPIVLVSKEEVKR